MIIVIVLNGLPEVRKAKTDYSQRNDILSLSEYARLVGIKESDLTSRSRKQKVSDAREVYWYELHNTGYSYPKIARMFNRRSHTSILSAKKRIRKLIDIGDDKIMRLYELLK